MTARAFEKCHVYRLQLHGLRTKVSLGFVLLTFVHEFCFQTFVWKQRENEKQEESRIRQGKKRQGKARKGKARQGKRKKKRKSLH